jgi:hypothetical protein
MTQQTPKKLCHRMLMSMIGLVLGVLMVAPLAFAAAKSEHAALVVKLDEDCQWYTGDTAEDSDIVAEGSVHYVETQNEKWKLSCHGDIVKGLPIDKAVILHSTAGDPQGECSTPFGSTFNWHITFSPSGTSSFSCHGDLTP